MIPLDFCKSRACFKCSHRSLPASSGRLALPLFSILLMIILTMGAAGLRQASCPFLNVAMTSVRSQWGPGGVTFTLWMFLKGIPCKVFKHWQRSSPTTGAASARRQAATRSRSSSAARRSRGAQGAAAVAVRAMALSSEVRVGGAWSTRAGGRAGGEGSVAPRHERTPFIHGRSGKLAAPWPGKFPDLQDVPGSGGRGAAAGGSSGQDPRCRPAWPAA